MHYRSISDMNDAIVRNLHRLPRDIDLVVGVPRSGILAAYQKLEPRLREALRDRADMWHVQVQVTVDLRPAE